MYGIRAFFLLLTRPPPRTTRTETLFPYTPHFRSQDMSSTETHLKQNYIGGQWVDSKGGKLHDVINPATEEAASTVVLGTAADVDDAVAAAKTAFKSIRSEEHSLNSSH